MNCFFCSGDGGQKVYDDGLCRVVIADEPFVGFCRVIWNAHAREMTDLPVADREHLMRTVFGVEAALRALLSPHKINVASLGNLVPHLHWHVVPRFMDDSHFPNPIWGKRKRAAPARPVPPDFAEQLGARIAEALGP